MVPVFFLKNNLFEIHATFQSDSVAEVCQGTPEIVIEGVVWSIRGHYSISWCPLSRMLNHILVHNHILWHPLSVRHFTKGISTYSPPWYWTWHWYEIWLFHRILKSFPKNIFNGYGMPTEDAYSSGNHVISHFGFAWCDVETNLSKSCNVFGLWIFYFDLNSIYFKWCHHVWIKMFVKH